MARPSHVLRHIHPSFLGQSVLLIGNGPSLRGVAISMFVETFPVVIRFNGFIPSPQLGRKTTVWCISDTVAVTHELSRESESTLCIIPAASPYAHTREKVARSLSHRPNVNIHPAVSSGRTTWPSTGILALEYFLHAYPTSAVFVCGFDHFATHPIHHYPDSCVSSHAFSEESQSFEQMANTSGRVFRLPHFK